MIRDVLDEMKRQLDTNLPEKLIAQDEKYDDGAFAVSLKPVTVYIGDRDISALQNIPAIILVPFDAELRDYTSGKKDIIHNIAMVVLVSDASVEAGQKRCWTILRAAENVFESQVGSWPLGVIGQYETVNISYTEIGGIQIGKDQTLWTSGIRCAIRERVDCYVSTQV